VNEFIKNGIELFHPQKVRFTDGNDSIVTPPILERSGEKYIVIEGLTRTYYCLKNGLPQMRAVIVEDVQALLPGKPFPIAQVSLTSATLELIQLINGFDKSLYRPIEEYIHTLPM
jgi:hypothetical protein